MHKNYLINFDSLPEVAKNRYNGIKINVQHSKFYKDSPAWAKKQAKKYVELIEKTELFKDYQTFEKELHKEGDNYQERRIITSLQHTFEKFDAGGETLLSLYNFMTSSFNF